MSTPPPQGQNPFAQGQPQAPYPPQQGAVPFAPVPPAPPARRFSKKLLRIVGIIVLAIIIGVVKWQMGKTDAETTSVGSCMYNKGTQISPDLKTVDCSSSDAKYKVVEKFDNTSDSKKCEAVQEAEISYYQQGDNHDVVLCLKEIK
ncbi:LppU/SCO3897 family protein [Streptomyces antibioticus]|uniref:LppU/SCO3897 family protein n=1 Tax=Streptomyces antibioticus TaxID=1890 RepID=UPI0033B0B62E